MQIRKARPSDAPAIARVHVDSWKTTYAGIVPEEVLAQLSYDGRADRWNEILADATGDFVFVAETEEGRVVGFVCGGKERSSDAVYQGEVSAIYLLEAYQGKGIGRRLIAAAAQELLARGFRRMLVWVLDANPSRGFYEALGGRKVRKSEVPIGGRSYPNVAYGWDDLRRLGGPP
jgi:L-amino acid N-acyltransferase YncA